MNDAVLSQIQPDLCHVVFEKVIDEAEMDEMWSFIEHKGQQRWLWHAIDHSSGAVLAYVLGSHKDAVFLKLRSL